MNTFDCPTECEKLCKASDVPYSLLKAYGLTDDEIKICDVDPSICLKGYLDSLRAEKICLSIYPASRTNDESDACRHFQWAALMADDIGKVNAEKILTAHENNPREPTEEREMDLANNKLGLSSYLALKKQGTLSDKALTDAFKKYLHDGKFVIIKPRYKSTGGVP